jgi:hypothetical protein
MADGRKDSFVCFVCFGCWPVILNCVNKKRKKGLDALIERQGDDIERGKKRKVVGVIASREHQILLCLIHVLTAQE